MKCPFFVSALLINTNLEDQEKVMEDTKTNCLRENCAMWRLKWIRSNKHSVGFCGLAEGDMLFSKNP